MDTGGDTDRAQIRVQADPPPTRGRLRRVVHLGDGANRVEVPVVAKIDECRTDRWVHRARSQDGHVAADSDGLEQERADNHGPPVASTLEATDSRIIAKRLQASSSAASSSAR